MRLRFLAGKNNGAIALNNGKLKTILP